MLLLEVGDQLLVKVHRGLLLGNKNNVRMKWVCLLHARIGAWVVSLQRTFQDGCGYCPAFAFWHLLSCPTTPPDIGLSQVRRQDMWGCRAVQSEPIDLASYMPLHVFLSTRGGFVYHRSLWQRSRPSKLRFIWPGPNIKTALNLAYSIPAYLDLRKFLIKTLFNNSN